MFSLIVYSELNLSLPPKCEYLFHICTYLRRICKLLVLIKCSCLICLYVIRFACNIFENIIIVIYILNIAAFPYSGLAIRADQFAS